MQSNRKSCEKKLKQSDWIYFVLVIIERGRSSLFHPVRLCFAQPRQELTGKPRIANGTLPLPARGLKAATEETISSPERNLLKT